MKKVKGFDVKAYQSRLRLLREIVSGGNQQEFAEKIGIPFKRWNNYERGYPVPRETAFILMEAFPGISVEWIWFGMMGNLSKFYSDRIKEAETMERERVIADATLARAKERVAAVASKRKRALHPAK